MPSKHLTVVLKAIPYERFGDESEDGHIPALGEDSIWYLKCTTLHGDLSLRESLVVTGPPKLHCPSEAPRNLSLRNPRKSLIKVQDDFIVPNGLFDADVQSARPAQILNARTSSSVDDLGREDREVSTSDDQWNIMSEWLADHISNSRTMPFEKALQLVQSRLSSRVDDAIPGIVSL